MKRTICIAVLLLTALLPARSDNLGLKTVVIDPGHGGKDPGSISRDNKTQEKTLTLDISNKLAALIREGFPDVKVVMTRSKDKYITLDGRAETANRANADLFISIHVNSAPSTKPHGSSIHVLGQSQNKDRDLFAYNMDVCMRENSVVLLEEDYSTKYQGFDPSDPESYIFMQLMQNAYLEQSLEFARLCSEKLVTGPIKSTKGVGQDPFYVLWKTSMPSVLVEVGFLSNENDLTVLRQDANRTKIAQKLFEAFKSFKTRYDASISVESAEAPKPGGAEPKAKAEEEKPATNPSTTPAKVTRYGVQVFSLKSTLPKGDPRLLGYEPVIIKSGSLNKYVIGVSDTRGEAEKKFQSIRKKYPDSFIVTLQ